MLIYKAQLEWEEKQQLEGRRKKKILFILTNLRNQNFGFLEEASPMWNAK